MSATETPLVLKTIAVVLILWALILHATFFFSAGALWRDEASSIHQARAGSWSALWVSLHYDSFPALYPGFLRVFVSKGMIPSDSSLRIFGVAIGVAILVSIWLAAGILGSRLPLVALALLAIDPLLISEGDSIRPYGVGLLCLVWSFCAYGRLLETPSAGWLVLASVASILAVQTAYTAAIFIGALGLSASVIILMRGTPRRLWWVLLPGLLAASSLLPYANTLRHARGWVSMLHYRVDWPEFLRGYVRAHSLASPLAWLLASLLGAYSLKRLFTSGRAKSTLFHPLLAYGILAAIFGISLQILFVQLMGVPPFPRYFLPGLVLTALALELLTMELEPRMRAIAVVLVFLIPAWPSWSWLQLRHSNADLVGRVLGENARPSDLVVVSPWFLHPSFQLYYRGLAPWATVPDLPQQLLTRYDLVQEAMADPERERRLYSRIQRTLSGGGAIWFVSQSYPNRPQDESIPTPPTFPVQPNGNDYVRFRSYWERAIIFRLYSCCRPVEWPLPRDGPIWDEECLVLTRWRLEVDRPQN